VEESGKNKKKSKSKSKSKSKYSKRHESSESSKFVIETSESGNSFENFKQTSNGEDSEEGLSIFPFNSSDVKSSLSIKNYRMLRRKI